MIIFSCNGKTSCNITANSNDLGIQDPCPGLDQLLVLRYHCGPLFFLSSHNGCYQPESVGETVIIHHAGLWGHLVDKDQCNETTHIAVPPLNPQDDHGLPPLTLDTSYLSLLPDDVACFSRECSSAKSHVCSAGVAPCPEELANLFIAEMEENYYLA